MLIMRNTISVLVVVILLIVGAVFLFNNKNGEREVGVYDEFAQCIYDSGLRMYGSATCSFCAKQRKLFEGSEEFIKEIECDPRNIGNEAERCINKNISHTPTWILEDEEGNDVTRFEAGVMSLERLSEESGCALPVEE